MTAASTVSLGISPAVAATTGQAVYLDASSVPARTEIAVVYDNGEIAATGNAHEPREAMSLAKLYLGYWVASHGSALDALQVETMIRFSDDGIASRLDRAYPQAIPEVIAAFGLGETSYNGYWGNTTTTVTDVARFLQGIRYDGSATSVINGMRSASPVAADGYGQNYGTAQIPGVEGTKFGWSDNRDVNGSASIGPGYSIAAITFGSAADITSDVLASVHEIQVSDTVEDSSLAGVYRSRLSCRIPATSSDAIGAFVDSNAATVTVPARVLAALPHC